MKRALYDAALLRLAEEREAGPEHRVLRKGDLAGRRVDAHTASAQIAQQSKLRGAKRTTLRFTREPAAIEVGKQSIRRLVCNIPQTRDKRRRARVDERARERRDTVARHAAGRRAARAQHHEVGVEIQPIHLL